MFTLMPYFTRFESSASKWLLKQEDRSKYFLRFNFEGLLRADSAGRATFYSQGLQNGWLSRNEVRALENRNAVNDPSMDEYTVQSNMAMIDQLAKLVAANSSQAPSKEHTINVSSPAVHFTPELEITTGNKVKRMQEIKTDVERAIEAMDKRSKDAVVTLQKRQRAFEDSVRESLDSGINRVVQEVARPRKAVFDDQGNPIGTIPVDTLH